MARRKPHSEPASHGQLVPVDDVLVRNHRLRQRVQRMVASQQAQQLSVEEAKAMAARIQKKGPQAIQALFDCLFDDDLNSHRLAVMLLSEMNDPAVFEKIHDFLQRPQLPEKVRVALLAIEAIHENPPDTVPMPTGLPSLSLDSLLQFTENFWEAMEMEEIAMMWRENFIAEPPEDRLMVLEVLMKSSHPKTLGIARLEIAVGDLTILEFLARKLGEFDGAMAASLLNSLLLHPHLAVRMSAEVSLNEWQQRTKNAPVSDDGQLPAPRFYRSYMATDEWSGHYSLVYAVKCPPDDTIKFVVLLLDRWDRGIVDCWGCVRYSNEEFEKLLATMAKDFADLRQEQITKRTALTLLMKAVDLNVHRKHPVPLEFYIWSHLFENENIDPDPAVPDFGVNCGVCRKPIRTGPRTSPPWVFGELVICHRCSKRPLRCPVCGGAASLPECLLTHDEPHDQVELRCPHCFESFRMPR